jgi:hypothetical protein
MHRQKTPFKKLLQIISPLSILATLAGCASYGTQLDCPIPDSAYSCEPVSSVAKRVEKKIMDDNHDEKIIYVYGGME